MSESPRTVNEQPATVDGGERGPIAGLARWLGRTPPPLLVVHGLLVLLLFSLSSAVYAALYGAMLNVAPGAEATQLQQRDLGFGAVAALHAVYFVYTASFFVGIVVIATALARMIGERRER